MQGDMLAQGWELLLYGMGTVVIFLGLLVIATSIMSRLVNSYFPEPEPAVVIRRRREAPIAEDDSRMANPDLVAVISAAVHQHRKGKHSHEQN
jgi:oxaloacetate decarboxylase gamma subunit